MALTDVVVEIDRELERLSKLKKMRKVLIKLLGQPAAVVKKHRMSASARLRISRAQKKRWRLQRKAA